VLSVNCHDVSAWRTGPVDCAVNADGGVSGVGALTVARGDAQAVPVIDGHYSVHADGAYSLHFRAVDGAGNDTAAKVDLKVDATAPAAVVSCVAGPALAYICLPSGSDAGSGLVALAYSVTGGAPVPIGNGSAFTVAKGTVVVTATDAAGNVASSARLTLAERTKPAADDKVVPRFTSEEVLLKRASSASKRPLGQIALSATPSKTTVDLHPLALGKGTFKLVLKITYGKKTKTVTTTQTTVKGYTKRIVASAPAAATAKVDLIVRRKSGKRWVTHAAAGAKL
jgi:hypothetical protein